MARFTEFPHFVIDGFNTDVILNSNTGILNNTFGHTILRGRGNTIVSNIPSGNTTTVYVYIDDFDPIDHPGENGFKRLDISYIGRVPDNDNIFQYSAILPKTIIPSTSTIPRKLLRGVTGNSSTGFYDNNPQDVNVPTPVDAIFYNEDIVYFDVNNKSSMSEIPVDYTDITGKDIYFRKDSDFHQYVLSILPAFGDIRDYVNTDKEFLYYGKIYQVYTDAIAPNNNIYHIEFIGIKDYVLNLLPSNNKYPNLEVFFDTYFDKMYHRNYNLLKDIWSMVDPYECDARFLHYIEKYFGSKEISYSTTDYSRREYLDSLLSFLKSKGTYNSIYILYKTVSNNSNNLLNLFEWWHSVPFPNPLQYNKFIYTSAYGRPEPNGESVEGDTNNIFEPSTYIYIDFNGKRVKNKNGVYVSTPDGSVSYDKLLKYGGYPITTQNGRYYVVSGEQVDLSGVTPPTGVDFPYTVSGSPLLSLDGKVIKDSSLLKVSGVDITGPNGNYLIWSDNVELTRYKSRGAGVSWYNRFSTYDYPSFNLVDGSYSNSQGVVQNSTSYEVNIDISDHPISSNQIVNKTFTDDFFGGCKELRPVNKVDHYSMMLSIKTSMQTPTGLQYPFDNDVSINIMSYMPSTGITGVEGNFVYTNSLGTTGSVTGISIIENSESTVGQYVQFDILPSFFGLNDITINQISINNVSGTVAVQSNLSGIYLPKDITLQVYYKMYLTDAAKETDNNSGLSNAVIGQNEPILPTGTYWGWSTGPSGTDISEIRYRDGSLIDLP